MMLHCWLSNHLPAHSHVENRGFAFSRCRSCRCDLIRSLGSADAPWRKVPAGFRVVWHDIDPDSFLAPAAWPLLRSRIIAGIERRVDGVRCGATRLRQAVLAQASAAFRTIGAGLSMITGFASTTSAATSLLAWQSRDALRAAARATSVGLFAKRAVIHMRKDTQPDAQPEVILHLHINVSRQDPHGRRPKGTRSAAARGTYSRSQAQTELGAISPIRVNLQQVVQGHC